MSSAREFIGQPACAATTLGRRHDAMPGLGGGRGPAGADGGDPVREQVTAGQLEPVVRAAYGARRRLVGMTRLRGGTRKGVYRLHLDDDSTVVLYLWDPA